MSERNGGFPDGDWRATPVSMTNSVTDTRTTNVTIGYVLEGIRNGRWRPLVQHVRDDYKTAYVQAEENGFPDPAAKAKDAVKKLKEGLPGVCPSGTFSRRENAALIEHSGFLVADIDSFPNAEALGQVRSRLIEDPHVQALFVSPTGVGIKVLIRIQPNGTAHRRSFLAVQKHFRERYNTEIDRQCCDESRLCFVSCDPEAYVREHEALVLEPQPAKKEATGPTPSEGVVEYSEDDAGNAALFIDGYGYNLRHVHKFGRWLIFRGRWMWDENEGVWRIGEAFRKALISAAKRTTDRKAEDAALSRAQALGKTFVMRNMLELAKTHEPVLLNVDDIDADPWLIGARNAVIDLRTGEAREHSQDLYITKSLAVDFVEGAQCARWLEFIKEVFPDPEVAKFVWKAVGYSLTGSVEEKIFFFLYGGGNNGKSRFMEAIFKMLGDYAKKAADAIFQVNPHGGEPQLAKAEIFGVRFLSGSEIKEDTKLNEKLIKDITGGDTISGRFHYEHSFDFSPTAKPWLHGNHDPVIKGNDEGIWSRVCKIPFTQCFEGAKADKKLGRKLLAEGSGILNWAIEGCLLWQREGLEMPKRIKDTVSQYRFDQDVLGRFLAERTRKSASGLVLHAALYCAYEGWADVQGMKYKLSSIRLGRLLREKGWEERRDGHDSPMWFGVELKGGPS